MSAEIERLSALIEGRKAEYLKIHKGGLWELIPRDLDFLTFEEKEEFHRAKLALPSYGQLAIEARERLAKRVAARKAAKAQ